MSALRKASPYIHHEPIDVADIEAQIGNTPLVGFRRITAHLPENIQIFAKAEWHNPGGSVKDRPALEIIRQALADGRLGNGKILMDSTSGNTGIAYAMLGAAKGFGVKLFMSSAVSKERIAILKAYGVDIEFTDPMEGSDGAIVAVRELAERDPETYFYADQYNNPANWQAHYKTTGVEIWNQTEGNVTHFVAGLGTYIVQESVCVNTTPMFRLSAHNRILLFMASKVGNICRVRFCRASTIKTSPMKIWASALKIAMR